MYSSHLNNNHGLSNSAKSCWLSLRKKKNLIIKYIFVLKVICSTQNVISAEHNLSKPQLFLKSKESSGQQLRRINIFCLLLSQHFSNVFLFLLSPPFSLLSIIPSHHHRSHPQLKKEMVLRQPNRNMQDLLSCNKNHYC